MMTTVDQDKAWGDDSVPQNLAVAQCAACGIRSFYGSDGTPMAKCALCNEVYYCDATCAAVDAPAHALTCAHARGRAKWPTKLAQFWIKAEGDRRRRSACRRRPAEAVRGSCYEGSGPGAGGGRARRRPAA